MYTKKNSPSGSVKLTEEEKLDFVNNSILELFIEQVSEARKEGRKYPLRKRKLDIKTYNIFKDSKKRYVSYIKDKKSIHQVSHILCDNKGIMEILTYNSPLLEKFFYPEG